MPLNNLVHLQAHLRGRDTNLLSLVGPGTLGGEFDLGPVALKCGSELTVTGERAGEGCLGSFGLTCTHSFIYLFLNFLFYIGV